MEPLKTNNLEPLSLGQETDNDPNSRDANIATLSAIADERINGTNSQSFTDWLRIAHQPNGEFNARQILATQKAQIELDNIILSETNDPTVSATEFFEIIRAEQEKDFSEDYQNILEIETAKALTDKSFGHPVRSVIIDQEELTISPDELTVEESNRLLSTDRSENLTAALLKLHTLQTKYETELMDLGISLKTAKEIAILVPFVDSWAQASTGERNIETLGNALKRDMSKIFFGPDPLGEVNKLEKKLEESDLPLLIKLDVLDTKDISDLEATVRSTFEALDLTGLGGTMLSLVRGLSKIGRLSRISKVAEDPQSAIDTTVDLAERAKPNSTSPLTVSDEDELIQNVLPSHVNSYLNDTSVQASRILDENQAQLDAAIQVRGQSFLSDEEQVQAIEILKNEITTRFPRLNVLDVQDSDIPGQVIFKLGTGNDGLSSFNSEKAAIAAANRMGIQPGFYKVAKENGVYHLNITRDLTDTTADGSSFLKGFESPNGLFTPLFLNKYLTGNKVNINFAQRLSDGGIVGVNAAAKLNEIFTSSTKLITKLNKKERNSFDAVMKHTQMNNGGKWLTSKQFKNFYLEKLGRKPTVNEEVAYGASIQLHKVDWEILNSSVRSDLVQKRFQEIGIVGVNETKVIGKELPTFDRKNLKNISIYDATTGDHYPKGTAASKLIKKLNENDNLVLVKYLDEVPINKNNTIEAEWAAMGKENIKAQYVIANKNNVSTTAIRHRVLNYFDGPHREYETPFFIKQSKVLDNTYLGTRTHFNVGSRDQALKYANQYNIALTAFLKAEKAVKANSSDMLELTSQASKAIQENTRYSSFDEFKQAIDKGVIERTPFEAWGDNAQEPFNFIELGRGSTQYVDEARDIDMDLASLSDTTKKYLDQGQLYYSKRGAHLPTPDGELAPILNATEIVENSIKHIIHTRAFKEYKDRHVKEWVQTYKPYLNTKDEARPDWYHFTYGQFRTGPDVPSSILKSGERVRTGLNRIVHAKSEASRRIDNTKFSIAQYALGDSTGVFDGLARSGSKGLLKLLDTDVVTGVRALTFKSFLGMMDASQIIVQTAMAPAIIGAYPRLGSQALTLLLPLRIAASTGNPKVLQYLASGVSKLGLGVLGKTLKPKDVKALMEDMKKSGVDIVGGTQAQLDNPFDGNVIFNNNISGRAIQFGNKALDVGLIPFKEGERLNQTLGFTVAWLEHFAKTGKRPIGDDLGRVLNKAETVSGNMKSSSRAAWQSGIASIPTQFAAHPVRVAENILFQQAGGLNKKQRLGFATGIVLTYGLAGLGMDETADKAAEILADATGQPLTPELLNKVRNGWVGHVFDQADIARIQPLKDNIVREILFNPDLPITDMFGPSGSLLGDQWGAFGGSILFRGLLEGTLTFSEATELVPSVAKDMFTQLPGPSRLQKAWHMHMYGMYRNKKGRLLDTKDYTNFDVAMQALGFPPKDSREVSRLTRTVSELQKVVSDDVNRIVSLALDLTLSEDKEEQIKIGKRIGYWVDLYKNQDPSTYRMFNKSLISRLQTRGKALTPERLKALMKTMGLEWYSTYVPERR